MKSSLSFLLFASSIGSSTAADFHLRPTFDAFVEGGTSDNYAKSSELEVKEIYADQTNVKLVRRSFLEFDLTQLSNHVVDVAQLRLSLKGSQKGAVISLCPAVPFSDNVPIHWRRQPEYNCDKSLGEVRYLPGMSTMSWDMVSYIQQKLEANATTVAFALIASEPHFITSFRSNEYKERKERPVLMLEGFVPPMLEEKFKPVLSGSRLHWPFSSPTAVSNGKFQGYANEHFQLVEGKYLQFLVQGAHHRCLLRHNSEFPISTETEKKLKARMYLPRPRFPTREATIIQMDSDGNTDEGALVRISWRESKDGIKDHLWVTLRTSLDNNETIKVPLFQRPDDFFDLEVSVAQSQIEVAYNGETLPLVKELGPYDASFWDSVKSNLFQAGILLNHGPGPAVALYDSLEVSPGGKKNES